MKNNKKSPLTLARQAKWIEEFGGDFAEITQPTNEFNLLCLELIGVDTEEQKAARVAMQYTAQVGRENSPELYGMTLRQTRQKYMGDVCSYRTNTGGDCNPELNEVEEILVKSSGHNPDLSKNGTEIDNLAETARFYTNTHVDYGIK